MATNRRPLKRRRVSLVGQAKAWRVLFETGHDFFGDLEALGLTEAGARASAEGAWRQLGRLFLERRPATRGGMRPWALEQFGPP